MENIWELVSIDDLSRLIKNNPKRFIIVGLVIASTEERMKRQMKKLMKIKHKEFPNILFLYYCVKNGEFGRISLTDRPISEYPLMYGIYDIDQLLFIVKAANENTIYEVFEDEGIQKIFLHNRQQFMEGLKQKNNVQKDEINNDDDNIDEPINDNSDSNHDENKESIDMPQNKPNPKNMLMEQKKLLDKILLIKKHADKFNLEFIKDIQERKREEESLNKDQHKSR